MLEPKLAAAAGYPAEPTWQVNMEMYVLPIGCLLSHGFQTAMSGVAEPFLRMTCSKQDRVELCT